MRKQFVPRSELGGLRSSRRPQALRPRADVLPEEARVRPGRVAARHPNSAPGPDLHHHFCRTAPIGSCLDRDLRHYIQLKGCSTRRANTIAVDELSAIFAALADPTRRAILERLAGGEATVNELAEPFPLTLQAVSKHLGVLERAGLIERRRTAQQRPSRLRGAPLKDAADWLETYRRLWQESFSRMDERLRASNGDDGD
jgi:DNA-binding transcriptional ArsR family regulator